MNMITRLIACDPFRVTTRRSEATINSHRALQADPRSARGHPLKEGRVKSSALFSLNPNDHLNPCGAKPLNASPTYERVGVKDTDADSAHLSADQSVCAGAGATGM